MQTSELTTLPQPPMTDHGRRNLETIRNIVAKTRLTETGYEINGREGNGKSFRFKGNTDQVADYPSHVEALAYDIYGSFYKEFPGDVNFFYPPQSDKIRRDLFMEELKAANMSRWSWIANWKLLGEESGKLRVEAQYYGPRLVDPAEFDGPDNTGHGRLRWTRDSTILQPSFYHFFGEEGIPAGWTSICRFYWDLCPEGAVPFVRTVSQTLNDQGIPFQAKVLTTPNQYSIADSGVLYLPVSSLSRIRPLLSIIHDAVRIYLNAPTPSFAKPLGPGLAFADDSGTGESFGQNRCNLIARALWDHLGSGGEEETLSFVLKRLQEKGYPLDRFHLNPTTKTDFEFKVEGFRNPLREVAV